MKIQHCGHSALLLETDGQRVLIDPGNYSDYWHGLTDLDAILVTHLHPDHVDPERVPALIAASPGARVLVEPSVVDAVALPRAEKIAADTVLQLGSLTVAAVGGLHAVIHKDIPQIGNVGLVLSAPGEPTFFHPGDALTAIPAGVDILGVPLYGPWAAMKETIDFVREVKAPLALPIHDALLSQAGWNLITGRVSAMTDSECLALRGGDSWAS